MSDLATPSGWTAAGTAEAVSLPRRHLVAIAILMCIPLPVLSLAATVIPLPQLLERAAANFATLAAPALGGNESVIRERVVAVGSVEIQYEPQEQRPRSTADALAQQAGDRYARDTPAMGAADKAPMAAAGSDATPSDPAGDAGSGSDEGAPGSGNPDTVATAPSDPSPSPTPTAEPPPSGNPAPNPGGGAGGSAGTGGTGGSMGGGGPGSSTAPGTGPKDPPPGGGTPSAPGGGTTPPGVGNGGTGGGPGSPPESPPGNGGGRP